MMTDFVAQSKRRSSEHVLSTRHALTLIKPYLSRFENWNHRAARASAAAMSSMSLPVERAQQAQLLAELFREVDETYDEFEAQVAGEPSHGRINDLRAAFLRLRSMLERWR